MRRARWPYVAVALTLITSGCADVVDGSGRAPAQLTPLASRPPASSTSSTSVPASAPSGGSATLAPGPEFSAVHYDIPNGFTATGGFVIDDPLEQQHRSYWVTPAGRTDGSAGVISVTVYTLPGPGLVDTPAQQVARIARYDKLVRATVLKPVRAGTLAGRPAYTDTVLQPPNFHLENWYTFGKTHFLQFTCQLGAAATNGSLQLGCDQLRESLRTN